MNSGVLGGPLGGETHLLAKEMPRTGLNLEFQKRLSWIEDELWSDRCSDQLTQKHFQIWNHQPKRCSVEPKVIEKNIRFELF